MSYTTLTAAELYHNLAGIRSSSSSAAGRKRLACETVHYLFLPGCRSSFPVRNYLDVSFHGPFALQLDGRHWSK